MSNNLKSFKIHLKNGKQGKYNDFLQTEENEQ